MITLKSLKNDYIVNIRPVDAPAGEVDQLSVFAYDSNHAKDIIQKILDRGVRVPMLGKDVEYMVESVYVPGSDEYATKPVEHNRPSAHIGSAYIV